MRKKEDGTRQAASNGNGKTETGQPGKKPAAAKVLLDRDQSRIVVELVRRRLKKLAKKGQKNNKGKEVKRLRNVASALGTDYRLKWSKGKDKYIVKAHSEDAGAS
jgi:hypothetical protein